MVTLFQIDKSGSDIFEKDYSIVIVVNKELVYGVNIPQKIKDTLNNLFKKGELNINHKSKKQKRNRFRIRFHTAVIVQLIEKIIYEFGAVENISIEICNDIDGHFHEIKDMIYKQISRLVPLLKLEDIVMAKFHKPSLIDDAGKAFRKNNKDKLNNYKKVDLDLEKLIRVIKK